MQNKFFFFIKLLFSVLFSLLIIFFIAYSKTDSKESYNKYFSQIVNNTISQFRNTPVVQKTRDWLQPSLKKENKESFIEYKLTILSKNVDLYLKNILRDTQTIILNNQLKKSIKNSSLTSLSLSKNQFKKYIKQNSDIQEISIYNLTGNQLISVKYKNIPKYILTDKIINKLKNKNNLLLKHSNTDYLILLSLVKDNKNPFMILSQTIHPVFFNRILTQLEMKKELFYLKDSHNYVILDNYQEFKNEKIKNTSKPYDLYQSLIDYSEKNLTIKLDDVNYSIGTIVEKNNLAGNLISIVFIIFIFSLLFIAIDFIFSLISNFDKKISSIKQLFYTRKKDSETLIVEESNNNYKEDNINRLSEYKSIFNKEVFKEENSNL